jgi:hypothetical protein
MRFTDTAHTVILYSHVCWCSHRHSDIYYNSILEFSCPFYNYLRMTTACVRVRAECLLGIFFSPSCFARNFFKIRSACPIFFGGFTQPPIRYLMVHPLKYSLIIHKPCGKSCQTVSHNMSRGVTLHLIKHMWHYIIVYPN